jgi:hypothetical protein
LGCRSAMTSSPSSCGSIDVDTQAGEFTEIKITLPRSGAFPPEPAVHA